MAEGGVYIPISWKRCVVARLTCIAALLAVGCLIKKVHATAGAYAWWMHGAKFNLIR